MRRFSPFAPFMPSAPRAPEGLDPTAEAELDMADIDVDVDDVGIEPIEHVDPRRRWARRPGAVPPPVPLRRTPGGTAPPPQFRAHQAEPPRVRAHVPMHEPAVAPVPANSNADKEALARALNDLEAAKARVERDAARSAQELREKLVSDLLPVLDNLDRSIRAAEAAGDAGGVVEGVRLVRSQFMGVLERFGVERISARQQPFNPAVHDAIGTTPVAHPSAHNVVVDEVESGYRFGERLLRPAKVIVGRHEAK